MRSWTIALLAGVVLFQQQGALPDNSLYGALSALALFSLLFSRRYLAARLLLACILGFLWSGWHATRLMQQQLPPEQEGQDIEVSGWVATLPLRDERRIRFNLEVEGPNELAGVSFPRLLALSWYEGAPVLKPGDHLRLVVRLKRPWGTLNPGGFDYEQWLLRSGVRATGYVRSGEVEGASWRYPLQRLRAGLYESVQHHLDNRAGSAIVVALALGEQQGISRQEWQLFAATGTTHLVSVSGLHVTLVAGLLFFLGRWGWSRCPVCALRWPAPRAGALLAMLGATLYAAMAGFNVPVQRSLIMVVLVLLAVGFRPTMAATRTLALALLAVLVIGPLEVLGVGLWLSFGSVALLLYAMQGRLAIRGAWWRWGRVHWVAAFGLLPLMALFFQQSSLSSPLANLVAVPWVGLLVVPLALLGTLLVIPLPMVGGWLLSGAAWLLSLLWPLLEWLAAWQPPLPVVAANGWLVVLAALGILWLLAPRGWPVRWVGVALLLPLLLVRPERPAHGQFWFTLLDVGQGLSAVVQTAEHTLVFDTGMEFSSGNDSGYSVVLPYLRHHGRTAIDTLVVSHGDSDHIGGMETLLALGHVGRLVTSVPEKMGNHPYEPCVAGLQWQWEGVNFEVLHPQPGAGEWRRGNDDSCVVRVSNGDLTLLLTGDIEAAAERELLARYGDGLKAELLVAPHHGSKSSSTEPFITAVAPRWVLFPVGYRNRYRHPAEAVIARYRQAGIVMVDSANSGAITLRSASVTGFALEEYRKVRQRYWHSRPLH